MGEKSVRKGLKGVTETKTDDDAQMLTMMMMLMLK